MKRGDIVLVVMAGDYGKPRPAVVVQSDEMIDFDFSSVVVPNEQYPVESAKRSGHG